MKLWFGRSQPNDREYSKKDAVRGALELNDALELQTRDEKGRSSMSDAFKLALDEVKAHVRSKLNKPLDALSTAFGQGEAALTGARGALDSQGQEIARLEKIMKTKAQRLKVTECEVRAEGILRHPWVRPLGKVPYAILLIITSAAVGVLNVSSFRTLRLAEPATMGLALFLASLYGLGIHLVPKGFGRKAQRGPSFWASMIVLTLMTAGTIALTQIRGDYLTIVNVTIDPWNFTVLQLFADAVAVLAAILYGTEDAVALRQAEQEASAAEKDVTDAKAVKKQLEKGLERKEQALYTLVENGVREVREVAEVEAKELITAFVLTLMKLREIAPELLHTADYSIELPAELTWYEQWLAEHAAQRHRPNRFGVRGGGPAPELPDA